MKAYLCSKEIHVLISRKLDVGHESGTRICMMHEVYNVKGFEALCVYRYICEIY